MKSVRNTLDRNSCTLLIIIWFLGATPFKAAIAADLYVDDDQMLYISSWPYGSIVQPSAEWRFGDGLDYDTTGGAFINYGDSALANQLTHQNMPGLTEGILSKGQSACVFDGVNDFMDIDDVNVLDVTTGDFTVAAWVRTTVTSNSGIAGKRDGSNAGWKIQMRAAGDLRLAVEDTDADEVVITGSGGIINDGSWHLVVGTHEAGDSIKIYVDDGVFHAADPVTDIDDLTNGDPFQVGLEYNYWTGNIAWVAFWKGTALTQEQIDSLYYIMLPNGSASEPFPSIQAAVWQASSGDNIYCQSGRYYETVSIDRICTISGLSDKFGLRPQLYGADLPATAGVDAIVIADTVEIEMIDISGYASGYGIYADSISDGSLFHHLVIDSCKYGAGFYGSTVADSLINCTVDGAGLSGAIGLRTMNSSENGNHDLYLYNNIFVSCSLAVLEADSFTMNESYNDFWNNSVDADGFSLDGQDQQVDPDFRGSEDYRLSRGSPLIDAGTILRFDFNMAAPDMGAWEFDPRKTYLFPRWGRRGCWGRTGHR